MTTEEQKPEGAFGPDPQPAAQQPEAQAASATTPAGAPTAAPTAAPTTAPSAPSTEAPRKSGPITGSIVWGTLILVFCAYVAAREMGGVIDPLTWIISTFIGLGALLLVVGVTIVLRGTRDRK